MDELHSWLSNFYLCRLFVEELKERQIFCLNLELLRIDNYLKSDENHSCHGSCKQCSADGEDNERNCHQWKDVSSYEPVGVLGR